MKRLSSIILAALLGVSALALPARAATSEAGLETGKVDVVRKTCECTRKHPSGFPYIEPRITECKIHRTAQGKVQSMDCANCYAVCTDKPAS